jgi:thymidine kinase
MNNKKGKLIAFFGPMYAGKSTSLINYVSNNCKNFIAYKPKIDNRYSENHIETHDGVKIPCNSINSVQDILIPDSLNTVIIDEIQFFNGNIVSGDVLNKVRMLIQVGNNVIVGGLDKDWRGEFFPVSHEIIKMADEFKYLKAKCFQCGKDAEFTYKTRQDSQLVEIGSVGMYEARCMSCWTINEAK